MNNHNCDINYLTSLELIYIYSISFIGKIIVYVDETNFKLFAVESTADRVEVIGL